MQLTISKKYALSWQQARLWSLQQNKQFPLIQAAWQIRGLRDRRVFRQSLQDMIQRHDILRTAISPLSQEEIPLQVITSNAQFLYDEVDLETLKETEQQIVINEAYLKSSREIFDLEQGPLMRAKLLCLSADSHILLVTFSALCADIFTPQYFFSELCLLYTSHLEQAEVINSLQQYPEASALQDELLMQEEADERKTYWHRHDLSLLASTPLPFERGLPKRSKPLEVAFSCQYLRKMVDPQVLFQLQFLAEKHNVTHSAILLTCWQILLKRLTAESENILIGVTCDGRLYEEFTGALGPYARVVPFIIDIDEGHNFQQLVEECDRTLQEIEGYQTYFTWEQRSILNSENESPPFFPIGFEARYWPPSIKNGEITCSLSHLSGHIEPFILKFVSLETDSELWTEIHYEAAVYTPDWIEYLIDCLHTLLNEVLTHKNTPVCALPILSQREQNRLLQLFSSLPVTMPEQPLHRLFEARVEHNPDSLAVVSNLEQISYSYLNARANQLAYYLQQQGVKPSMPVGLCVKRSANMLVGMLAIFKAGGAYLPLEPDNPPARLNLFLTEAQVSLLVTEEELRSSFSVFSGRIVTIDGEADKLAKEPTTNPANQCNVDDLAYIIYTSGSTGGPKAVMVQHRSVINYTCYMCTVIAPQAGLHFATVSTLAADLGNTPIFCSLASGGCLHILSYDEATSGRTFFNYMTLWPLDILKMVPSHLQVLLDTNDQQFLLPRLALILGGEPFPYTLFKQLRQLDGRCHLINHYGPTEATIGALINDLGVHDSAEDMRNQEGWSTVPIGKPIANMQALILDRFGHIVPLGVAGELYLGGAGVALGYFNEPEQSRTRFVTHPLSTQTEARLYKTGDLAYYTPEGMVTFLGRVDNQIKLHGYRVELEEIEVLLEQHPLVRQCVVLLKGEQSGNQKLVAFVLVHQPERTSARDLRLFLSNYLPEYMIPSTFSIVDEFPLTPNGKVDRLSLLEQQISEVESVTIPPGPIWVRDMLEFQLLQIWKEILKTDSIGVTDNFFDLGGHSFLAISLMSRIHRQFGLDIPLTALFQYPTIADLAVLIRQQTVSRDWPTLVKMQGNPSGYPLFLVHPAGGDIFCYQDLARHLGPDQLVYGLQVFDSAEKEEYLSKLEDIAAHYVASIRTVQPQGPYLLGGLSAGGVIAFEMAQQLQGSGEHIALLALIDSRAPIPTNTPSTSIQLDTSDAALAEIVLGRYDVPPPGEDFYQLAPEEQLHYAMEQAKLIGTLPMDATIEQFRRSLRKTVANIYAVNTYIPRMYSGRLTFFRAMDSSKDLKDADKRLLDAIRQSPTYGWNTLTTQEVEVHLIPGTHIEILNEPNVYVLAKMLRSCLDKFLNS